MQKALIFHMLLFTLLFSSMIFASFDYSTANIRRNIESAKD